MVGAHQVQSHDANRGRVAASRAAAWAEGGLRTELAGILDTPVSVIGDGDAHALALTRLPDVEYGGIAISLGASLGFGALNHHGALIHPCGHTGWDLGHWRLVGDGANTEAWWALGGHGLYDLEREHGDGAAEIYAYRLGSFLVDTVQLFRPIPGYGPLQRGGRGRTGAVRARLTGIGVSLVRYVSGRTHPNMRSQQCPGSPELTTSP